MQNFRYKFTEKFQRQHSFFRPEIKEAEQETGKHSIRRYFRLKKGQKFPFLCKRSI